SSYEFFTSYMRRPRAKPDNEKVRCERRAPEPLIRQDTRFTSMFAISIMLRSQVSLCWLRCRRDFGRCFQQPFDGFFGLRGIQMDGHSTCFVHNHHLLYGT